MPEKEFSADPYYDYDTPNGNQTAAAMLMAMIATLDSLTPCTYMDHIQGTNVAEWMCPECKTRYTGAIQPHCSCKAFHPAPAVEGARLLREFMTPEFVELLDRAYVLDKPEKVPDIDKAAGVRHMRMRLFDEAVVAFVDSVRPDASIMIPASVELKDSEEEEPPEEEEPEEL